MTRVFEALQRAHAEASAPADPTPAATVWNKTRRGDAPPSTRPEGARELPTRTAARGRAVSPQGSLRRQFEAVTCPQCNAELSRSARWGWLTRMSTFLQIGAPRCRACGNRLAEPRGARGEWSTEKDNRAVAAIFLPASDERAFADL